MASLEEIRSARIKKLQKIIESGNDPFPASTSRNIEIKELATRFEELEPRKEPVVIAGRVMTVRAHGALIFADLNDGSGKFQILLKKGDPIEEKDFDFWNEIVDIGDFVEVSGTLFLTKRKEKTLQVSKWKILSKSLRPLPEKWHGLTDQEERFRKRYLDFLMNEEERELMVKKSKFWDVIRGFFKNRGFVEVETPTLEITTGGAEARPFKTHHNDFDIDLFLRISVGELWQKRLIAGGFPKIFEIGRVYRNEGTSPEHLQEFTNMEFYWAYADFRDGMKLVKELYIEIAKEVFGRTKFTTRGHSFDLSDDWKEIDYSDEIKRQTGIDIHDTSKNEIKDKLEELEVEYEGENLERLIDTLWKYCRKNISGPAFLINHPVIIAPLAKMSEDKKTAQMFQPIIAGSEVGRGYSELNDPIDQRKRFEDQQKMIDQGDEEAMMADWEFVEMLEYGMPPTCGFGFGERFFAFLADRPLREVQTFPLMRPKG